MTIKVKLRIKNDVNKYNNQNGNQTDGINNYKTEQNKNKNVYKIKHLLQQHPDLDL